MWNRSAAARPATARLERWKIASRYAARATPHTTHARCTLSTLRHRFVCAYRGFHRSVTQTNRARARSVSVTVRLRINVGSECGTCRRIPTTAGAARGDSPLPGDDNGAEREQT